jgi:3-phosphoshikimate 1-carboxyvinyltransferase
MTHLEVNKVKSLSGAVAVPGDKSISHRAVMLSAIAEGETLITNFLNGDDPRATIDCLKEMGVKIEIDGITGNVKVFGAGLEGLKPPKKMLYVGNSGTTIRILSGILAGQAFESTVDGDASIRHRPMGRIVEPLRQMGALIRGEKNGLFAPLTFAGTLPIPEKKLKAINYVLPVASAQIKSCLLMAGLYAEGKTVLSEPSLSRDHTERMLKHFKVEVVTGPKGEISLNSGQRLIASGEINVPADISSAAFWLVAGAIVPEAKVILKNVGVNPTRTGIIEALHRMGADLIVSDEQIISHEPRATLTISSQKKTAGKLMPIEIAGNLIPRLIDEIPVLAVLATQIPGKTIIKDAKELRVKESDRVAVLAEELGKMGANITERPDGLEIIGPTKLIGTTVNSHGDHRIAMSLAIAGLVAEGKTLIEDTACIETSYPGFKKTLDGLSAAL